jgi:hypothetical protein
MFVVDRVVLRVQGFANRIEAMQRMHDLHSERSEFLYSQSDLGIPTPRYSGSLWAQDYQTALLPPRSGKDTGLQYISDHECFQGMI